MAIFQIGIGQVGGEGTIQPDAEPVVLHGDTVPVPLVDGVQIAPGGDSSDNGAGAIRLNRMKVIDIDLIAIRRVDLLMLTVDQHTGVDGTVGIEFQFQGKLGKDLAGDQKPGLIRGLTDDLLISEGPGGIAGGGPVGLFVLDQPFRLFTGHGQEYGQ